MLVKVNELLKDATENHYGVPAINVINIETAHYAALAAEQEHMPVIIQFFPGFKDYAPLSAIAGAAKYYAERASVPIAVHQDHSQGYEIAVEGIRDGFPSVMVDGSSLPFEEIVEKTRSFIKNMKTYFVLESLDTLRKNGRLTGLQAFFATALNIKPVMGADSGVIIKLDQARGINKALTRMADIAIREAGETKDKVLIIAHCNNPERAEVVKNEMCRQATFKDVIITETAGVATVYASDGGIIVAL